MRNFVLGVIFTLVVLALIGVGFALLGFVPTNADTTPPKWEERLANSSLDASMERHAPRANNPLPPTDDTIIDGMKVYTMNCAGCHGDLNQKEQTFGRSFYPPAPQLILHPPDDPDWHLYYAIRTGVRYTGMPAWEKTMSDSDIWKVTTFLTHMEKLSPAAQQYWKKSFGVDPPTQRGEAEEKDEHHHD